MEYLLSHLYRGRRSSYCASSRIANMISNGNLTGSESIDSWERWGPMKDEVQEARSDLGLILKSAVVITTHICMLDSF